jgi:hypothetical protein
VLWLWIPVGIAATLILFVAYLVAASRAYAGIEQSRKLIQDENRKSLGMTEQEWVEKKKRERNRPIGDIRQDSAGL